MSQYGTTQDYCTGYDEGADETMRLHKPLVKAAKALSKRWATGKNMSAQIQALDAALAAIGDGRHYLDETTYPERG
jgi:hypothetical protein